MTTLTVVDYHPDETRSEAVARRLRGELAQLHISASEAARRLGFTQAFLSRRLTGRVPFHVDELELICTTLGLSFVYITSGIRALPDGPPAPDGGDKVNWRARRDSNSQPSDQYLTLVGPARRIHTHDQRMAS